MATMIRPIFLKTRVFSALHCRGLSSTLSSQRSLRITSLPHKSLLSVSGDDSATFLQGLLTNDVRLLQEVPCLYSLLLNIKGRVVSDLFLYRLEADHLLMELHRELIGPVMQLLHRYRIRRKITLEDVTAEWNVSVVFPQELPSRDEELLKVSHTQDMILVADPRNSRFGLKILNSKSENILRISGAVSVNPEDYQVFRYSNGIAEDIEIVSLLPHELNADLVNAVSFDKGCYVGQELVSRAYHVGVIRKRLLPISLDSTQEVCRDSPILDSTGKTVGKLRAQYGCHGLAVLKFPESITKGQLTVGNIPVKTWKPSWWPKLSHSSSTEL